MAPELMKGQNYNEKIDIWAVGLITYELLTGGKFPFSMEAHALRKQVCADKIIIDYQAEQHLKNNLDAQNFIKSCLT